MTKIPTCTWPSLSSLSGSSLQIVKLFKFHSFSSSLLCNLMCCSRHVKGEKVQRTTFIHSPSKADVFTDCSTSFKLQNFNFFTLCSLSPSNRAFQKGLETWNSILFYEELLRLFFHNFHSAVLSSIEWREKKIGETEKKILQRTREKRRRNKFNPE